MISAFDLFPKTYLNIFDSFLYPKKLIVKGNPNELARQVFDQLQSGAYVIDMKLFQTKQHKKKRVNKKWKKRYGYTCIIYYE